MTREEAIEWMIFQKEQALAMSDGKPGTLTAAYDMAIEVLQAEPKHGKWVESKIPNELYVCSNCGGACWSYDYERTIVKSNFCPNCGAKMDKKTTWHDTLKYWNGKEILRECKDKNRLCVHANVWNTCVDKPCEKGDPMTNREWLESLSDEEFADMIAYENCGKTCAHVNNNMCGHLSCESGIAEWLKQEYEPPKKELSQAQLCEAFELKFGKRRAISLDEVREVTKEIFR